MRHLGGLSTFLIFVSVLGCGSTPGNDGDRDGGLVDGDGSPIDGDGGPGDPTACVEGEGVCVDESNRSVCSDGAWQDEACASGSGCFAGDCVAGACSDACNLGDVDGERRCELFDISSGTWVDIDAADSTHDRARDYTRWLRRDSMAYGGVAKAHYSDPPAYEHVTALGALPDSALWTGSYLAAEALRLRATGSATARANIEGIVDTLHLWLSVPGDPGTLARFVAPSDAPSSPKLDELDCAVGRVQCDVTYDGKQYDYIGHISRDQYQGVMLGYALAYEALGPASEATREIIRADVVEIVEELMKERTLPVRLIWNGTDLGVYDIDMRFVLLESAEQVGGVTTVTIDSGETDGQILGLREFMPNFAHVIRQFPLLGFTPDIPRPGTAIMLSSFFHVALKVTEGVDSYAGRRAAIEDYYVNASGEGGNVSDWLDIADDWDYLGECGASYFANNIVMMPMYNLARLESDPSRGTKIRDDILDDRMWSLFHSHKNVLFSYMYSATMPGAAASIAGDASDQLAGYPAPPRVARGVDLRDAAKYKPHEPDCTNQTNHDGAVDVADRVPSDFMWQHNPWDLRKSGQVAQTFPGVDYLLAYWVGRRYDYLSDDRAGTCLAWRK